MKIPIIAPTPIAIHIPVSIKQCAFCSFNTCICDLTFQQLVDKDMGFSASLSPKKRGEP